MPYDPLILPPDRNQASGPFANVAKDVALLRAAIEELHRRTVEIYPQSSPTVKPKITPTGTLYDAIIPAHPRPFHPWRVSGNGTDTLTVGKGKVLFATAKGTPGVEMAPIVYLPVSYAGGSVTVTGDGYIYLQAQIAESVSNIVAQIALTDDSLAFSVRKTDTLAVVFSTDAPGVYSPADIYVYWPIAQVTLSGGVASVEEQILFHNPTHDLETVNPAD